MKEALTPSLLTAIAQRVKSWFEQAKTLDPEDDLVALPDTVQAELAQKLRALPSPEAYQTALQTDITAAVQTWQQNLDAPNHLIFLGNPVEPIAKILADSLETWSDAPVQVATPLPCLSRPRDPLTMAHQIRQALEPWDNTHPDQTDETLDTQSLEKRTTLIVVPCLEQCFLRCIGGWESIELLRDIAIHNRSHFWVLGCNRWAWDFLDFTNQISAYFSAVKTLPELDAAMLRQWLSPIAQSVIDADSEAKKASPEKHSPSSSAVEADDDAGLAAWKILAIQSAGVSQIAAHLWLQSLRIKAEPLDPDQVSQIELDDITDDQQDIGLQAIKASLPSLPSLDNRDRYLLHSLMIHGAMSRAHLALSLGEPESQVQDQIQRLLREQVLVQRQGVLSIRAVHYTKLKAELANNNFFVGKD